MVSKKKSKKNLKIFTFLNWEKQTWYWEKRWLFSIGNGAEIRPLEMGRKSPGRNKASISCNKLNIAKICIIIVIMGKHVGHSVRYSFYTEVKKLNHLT